MAEAPRPEHEPARLLALEQLGILDTPEERAYDAITHVAAAHYACRVSLVTFVDAQRQWFKASHGWDVRETSRDLSFCAHAILQPLPLVVADTRTDERFRDNPLVTGAPFIRFYAGVPLTTSDGYRLGTLCVLDDAPRSDVGPDDLAVLEDLAEVVVEKLELRLQNAQTWEERKRFEGILGASQDALMACDAQGNVTWLNDATETLLGLSRATLLAGSIGELESRLLSADGLPLDRAEGPATRVLARGTALPVTTFGLQRDDGSLRWLRVQAAPLLDRHGGVEGVALSLQPFRALDASGWPEPA